jgi:hypothetical protein
MSEPIDLVKEDVKKMKALATIPNTEGGKILIDSLGRDVVNGVESLISSYKEESDIKLRATIAKLQSDLALLRVLTRAEENSKVAQEALKNLLEE